MDHKQHPMQGKDNFAIKNIKRVQLTNLQQVDNIKSVKLPQQGSTAPCCGNSNQSSDESKTDGYCCGPQKPKLATQRHFIDKMIVGYVEIDKIKYPQVLAQLTFDDLLGSFLARIGYKRDDFEIRPGLYALGNPDADSNVLVTANYKMTFDALRKTLAGENVWIMVLDTFGINVWCAAGKGTFSTAEIIRQVQATQLTSLVNHRKLILPQLGAPGVDGFKVTKATGFQVIYGPVRAEDVRAFIQRGMVASPEMRRVRFTTWDRLVLTPLEFYLIIKPLSILVLLLLILGWTQVVSNAWIHAFSFMGSAFIGSVIVPLLLPFLPGKAFSIKGAFAGMVYSLCLIVAFPALSLLTKISYGFLLPSISAYVALNFTGASTFTSFSGVKAEMEVAVPLMLICSGIGVVLFIAPLIMALV